MDRAELVLTIMFAGTGMSAVLSFGRQECSAGRVLLSGCALHVAFALERMCLSCGRHVCRHACVGCWPGSVSSAKNVKKNTADQYQSGMDHAFGIGVVCSVLILFVFF